MRAAPRVNAGSMADIAFLLLIFFLVTTTMAKDEGINRKLPRNCPPGVDCSVDINERNILRIVLNNKQEIMVNDEIILIEDLKDIIKKFIDNNGDKSCTYCNGISISTLSDNPKEAVISLQNNRETSYELFIKVQDELTKAYYELREVYANNTLGKSVTNLTSEEIKTIRKAYPFVISEAETK
ncbi:MAG: biopolymer transporter ExbD [Flavobacteriaceae bacterium]|nr:biopolymer transporter ExbD [Flavobacteriaceae bacterium]